MKILMVMIKNSGPMDYAVPILWKVKAEHPSTEISVLYCRLSKREVTRGSAFFSDVLASSKIREYDLLDFLDPLYAPMVTMYRLLEKQSEKLTARKVKAAWSRRFLRLFARFLRLLMRRTGVFLRFRIKYGEIMRSFNADVILLDHTASSRTQEQSFVGTYLNTVRKRVYLLPHAPHHAAEIAFQPYLWSEERLPDFCEFWMPFKYERSWEAIPEKKHQFAYVGYPGLDTEWLQFARSWSSMGIPKNFGDTEGQLNCLFVIRRFLNKGQKRKSGDNVMVYSYEEFEGYTHLLARTLKNVDRDVIVTVKPHPSNAAVSLRETLDSFGLRSWRITNETIYGCLTDTDFIVSLYSTVFFVPAMAGIPVLALRTSSQEMVEESETLSRLYEGFHFYVNGPDEFPLRFDDLIDHALKRRIEGVPFKKDMDHLRNYYPDGSIGRAMQRIGL